jgi:hypothetical protein
MWTLLNTIFFAPLLVHDYFTNKFADFFTQKIVTIRHNIDAMTITDTTKYDQFDNATINCELIELSPTSEEELSGLVKNIASKSCCLDPIPASLLGYCISNLLRIIRRVVNMSFESTVVPSSMKKAVLCPSMKKVSLDFEIFANFRPVSNLNFLSKVMEKVAAARLWDYLCENDHHSCETALTRVQNDILTAIDNKQCVALVLLDLSAAFALSTTKSCCTDCNIYINLA